MSRLIALSTSYLLIAGLAQAQTLQVELRESAQCAGAQILLGEIAEISGAAAKVKQAEQIVVGAAPSVGKSRRLPASQVRVNLLRAGYGKDGFELTGAPEVEISRASQEIAAEEILNFIKQKAEEQLLNQELELEFANSAKPVSVPPGAYEIEVSHLSIYGSNSSCTVIISVENKPVKTIRYSLKVLRYGDVLVATRDLDKGSILTAEDMIPQRTALIPGREFLLAGDDFIGSELQSRLVAGAPAPKRAISQPQLIKKGDLVRVRAQVGGCEVTCQAEALEDGRLGDRIRLKAAHTEDILTGKVSGPQLADVIAAKGGVK